MPVEPLVLHREPPPQRLQRFVHFRRTAKQRFYLDLTHNPRGFVLFFSLFGFFGGFLGVVVGLCFLLVFFFFCFFGGFFFLVWGVVLCGWGVVFGWFWFFVPTVWWVLCCLGFFSWWVLFWEMLMAAFASVTSTFLRALLQIPFLRIFHAFVNWVNVAFFPGAASS